MKTLITKQWPFWLGGLFVGLADIERSDRFRGGSASESSRKIVDDNNNADKEKCA